MGKVITSPSKKYPGSVTLPDALTAPQAIAFQEALDNVQKFPREQWAANISAYFPGLCAVVQAWNITGFPEHPTPETLPVTPVKSAATLYGVIIGEVVKLIEGDGEDDNPND